MSTAKVRTLITKKPFTHTVTDEDAAMLQKAAWEQFCRLRKELAERAGKPAR